MDNHFYYSKSTSYADAIVLILSLYIGKDPTPPPPYYTPVSTATPAHNVYSSSEYSPAPRTFYPAPLQIPATSTVNVIHARQPTMYSPTVIHIQGPPSDHMLISLFACLFCFWPTAIVALMYSCKVTELYNTGNNYGAYEASRNALLWAKISIIIGVILFLLSVIGSLVIPVFMGALFSADS
jgi:hypothetical protein